MKKKKAVAAWKTVMYPILSYFASVRCMPQDLSLCRLRFCRRNVVSVLIGWSTNMQNDALCVFFLISFYSCIYFCKG